MTNGQFHWSFFVKLKKFYMNRITFGYFFVIIVGI